MSSFTILLAGALSIILWFEVASTPDFTSGERTTFVIAGLVETLLFIVSILGFSGAIARKQLFVMIYAYFLYAHLVLNIGVASYLLWMISHAKRTDVVEACQQAIQNAEAKSQCTALLQVAEGVYVGGALVVLFLETYGAIIVARYVNQLKSEKRSLRASRMLGGHASRMMSSESGAYLILKSPGQDIPLDTRHSHTDAVDEFDPYEETLGYDYTPRTQAASYPFAHLPGSPHTYTTPLFKMEEEDGHNVDHTRGHSDISP